MTREKFIDEIENLTLGFWLLKNTRYVPMMSHVMDEDENIISTISETKFAKFDFNGSNLDDERCEKLLDIVTEYSCTPLEER